MKDEINKPTKKEHKYIVRFLKDEFVPYCIQHQYNFEVDLEVFLSVVQNSYGETQVNIAQLYEDKSYRAKIGKIKDQSTISRILDKINEKLKIFCEDKRVFPPIQFFTYYIDPVNGKKKKNSCFLACSKAIKGRKKCAEKIFHLKEAKQSQHNISSLVTKHTDTPLPLPFSLLQERLEKKLGRYPCLEDLLEKGSYYRHADYHTKIREILQRHRKCLILGDPGSGKTSLAIALGYEFLSAGHCVYYCDATSSMGTIAPHLSWEDNTLLILDNAHSQIEEVNELISLFADNNIMLLMTSRKVPKHNTFSCPLGCTHYISYLDFFDIKKEQVELQINEETIYHIVKWHGNRNEFSENQIGNLDALIIKCNEDYNVLRFYIETWSKTNYNGFLSDLLESDILPYIYHHYSEGCSFRQQLLKISSLAQAEIDVDSKWLRASSTVSDHPFSELQRSGLIGAKKQEVESGRHVFWLRVYHPTAASYFLEAAANSLDCNDTDDVDEFIKGCLKEYLKSEPYNFFLVCSNLLVSTHKDDKYASFCLEAGLCKISESIIQRESSSYIKNHQFTIFVYIRNLVEYDSSLKRWAVERLFIPLINRCERNLSDLYALRSISEMYNIFNLADLPSTDLTSKLDFEFLGKNSNTKTDWPVIWSFVEFAAEASVPKDKIVSFCKNIINEGLERKISNKEASWDEVLTYIILGTSIGLTSSNIWSVCKKVDFGVLGIQARYSKLNWIELGLVIKHTRNTCIPETKIANFCKALDFESLGSDARQANSSWLAISTLVISLIRDIHIPKKLINDFLNGYGLDLLAKCIRDDDAPVINLGHFLSYIVKAGVKDISILHLCETLNFEELGRNANNNIEWFEAWNFINKISEIDYLVPLLDSFCQEIDFSALSPNKAYKKQEVSSCDVHKILYRSV